MVFCKSAFTFQSISSIQARESSKLSWPPSGKIKKITLVLCHFRMMYVASSIIAGVLYMPSVLYIWFYNKYWDTHETAAILP